MYKNICKNINSYLDERIKRIEKSVKNDEYRIKEKDESINGLLSDSL